MSQLVFLKWGGSLITDKSQRSSADHDRIARLAGELQQAREGDPDLQVVLGHGSGSFGHIPARKHGTRKGVHTPAEWHGFAEVWFQASALTRIVIEALEQAAVPAIALSPSASVIAANGRIVSWDLEPLRAALAAGLVPVIHGDVIFDRQQGGTILSTEDLFVHLAGQLKPQRLLLAGIEPGVWQDYPVCSAIIPELTPASFEAHRTQVAGSEAVDVTGGMASKVKLILDLCTTYPELKSAIFDGVEPGRVRDALLGAWPGTILHAD
jgi:isopentenyl phosphate kinase